MPSHVGSWECVEDEEGVTCTTDSFFPAGRGEDGWSCWYRDELIYCEDNLGDDGSMTGCICIPGSTRYCDTPTYCSWGVQVCYPSGEGWGPCVETRDIPDECESEWGQYYMPESERCCIDAGYCCQDYYDLDGDGDNSEALGSCWVPERCD